MSTTPPTGRIVIAGGSGFLGQSLARHLVALDAGADVVILSRHPPRQPGIGHHATWDARTMGEWCSVLDGASGLVNLVGRSVDCIKTPDHCDEILRSRVEATRVLGLAMRSVTAPPATWVQMSTAHAYGDPPDIRCDEDSLFGIGLAPTVARAWEDAFAQALPSDTRGVILRTSFVLGKQSAPIRKLAGLARIGLGGTVGHGRQGMSWIHELDMNRIFARALTDASTAGVYVATAPNPVSNAEFMREIRRAVRAPFGLPTFEWMVRLVAPLLLRTDPELALYGRYCVPTRLLREGFEFLLPDLPKALAVLAGK